jgi:hypothetical protein
MLSRPIIKAAFFSLFAPAWYINDLRCALVVNALPRALTMLSANRSHRNVRQTRRREGKPVNDYFNAAGPARLDSAKKVPQIQAHFGVSADIWQTLNVVWCVSVNSFFGLEYEAVVFWSTGRSDPINVAWVPGKAINMSTLRVLSIRGSRVFSGEESVHLRQTWRLDKELEIRVGLTAPS